MTTKKTPKPFIVLSEKDVTSDEYLTATQIAEQYIEESKNPKYKDLKLKDIQRKVSEALAYEIKISYLYANYQTKKIDQYYPKDSLTIIRNRLNKVIRRERLYTYEELLQQEKDIIYDTFWNQTKKILIHGSKVFTIEDLYFFNGEYFKKKFPRLYQELQPHYAWVEKTWTELYDELMTYGYMTIHKISPNSKMLTENNSVTHNEQIYYFLDDFLDILYSLKKIIPLPDNKIEKEIEKNDPTYNK